MPVDINHVLRIYLGANSSGGFQPVGCDDRLKEAFPEGHQGMLEQVAKYLDKDHEPNWVERDLEQEAKLFAEALQKKYPELDRMIVSALVDRWCYSWK